MTARALMTRSMGGDERSDRPVAGAPSDCRPVRRPLTSIGLARLRYGPLPHPHNAATGAMVANRAWPYREDRGLGVLVQRGC